MELTVPATLAKSGYERERCRVVRWQLSCYSQAKNLRKESGKYMEWILLSRLKADRKGTGQERGTMVEDRDWEEQKPSGRWYFPDKTKQNTKPNQSI